MLAMPAMSMSSMIRSTILLLSFLNSLNSKLVQRFRLKHWQAKLAQAH